MEEAWRELARTVPAALLRADVDATLELIPLVYSAQNKLGVCISLARLLVAGVEAPADVPDPHPAGRDTSDVIEAARRSLRRLMELHASAGHAFDLYGAHRGLAEAGDPLWQRWAGHRAEALGHAAAAARRLRAAAAHSKAADDAIRVALSSPPGSAWLAAFLNLSRRAFWSVATAAVDVREMCSAVEMEFADAWAIILSHV
ncbi:hypothetical protein ACP4OV_022061 [Aristida adscensionis]